VVVVVRFEVTDEQRAAVRRSKGENGLATRAEIAGLAEFTLTQELDELVASYAPRARRTVDQGKG
jgi:hypothetical protein